MAADGSLPTIARDLPPGPFSAWAGPHLTVCAFWPSPGGHGSHGPTLCTPPAGRAPQPGGLSPFGETQNPRLVAQPEVLEPLGSVAGRAPWRGGARNLPIQMLTVPPVALRYQRSYPTTRYGGLSRCRCRVTGHFVGTICRVCIGACLFLQLGGRSTVCSRYCFEFSFCILPSFGFGSLF